MSPRVANAHESTPEFEASMSGSLVIPATWGDLASRICEAGLVEPTVDDVCDYLKISREVLVDPEIARSPANDIYDLRRRVEQDLKREFVETHGETADEFGAYIDERVSAWAVEDGEVKGDEIQRQIDTQVPDRFSDEWSDYYNDYRRVDQTSLLCLKRDALHSGVEVPLIDFVETVFAEYKGKQFFTKDELAGSIGVMVDDIIRKYVLRDPEQIKVEDVVLGKDQVDEFMYATREIFRAKTNKHVRQNWERLEPFLYAPAPSTYPLLER